MTHGQIFESAIAKARGNGWDGDTRWISLVSNGPVSSLKARQYPEDIPYQFVIFSHDFAKAFWGEQDPSFAHEHGQKIKQPWEGHLQRMVLEVDPIKYLEKFL